MRCLAVMVAAGFAATAMAVPKATLVGASQGSDRVVRISYDLVGAPAVVTMDVQTNRGDGVWVTIGAENIFGPSGEFVRGANAAVAENGRHEISWRPRKAWRPGADRVSDVKFVLKAYARNNAPDYMAVRLEADIGPAARVMFYPDAQSVPGGVVSNENYRQSILLMRRVHAKNLPMTLGDPYPATTPVDGQWVTVPNGYRAVTFTNDFYMGVFETTQKQWEYIMGTKPSHWKDQGDMRPVEYVSYLAIRESAKNPSDASNRYPQPPYADSFLGKLRTRSTLDFDLPSEAEWEYAARSGLPGGYWNDGVLIANTTTDQTTMPGRCATKFPATGPQSGTAICGSFAPSRWGFYDFHGNVLEWCLDWWTDDVRSLPGATVNANGDLRVDQAVAGEYRTLRGGYYGTHDSYCDPLDRYNRSNCREKPANGWWHIGFRVKCQGGLK